MNRLRPGDKITGTIILVSNEYIFLDIQEKNDAILPIRELSPEYQNRKFKIGETIPVFVSRISSDSIQVSQVMNKKQLAEDDLRNAFNQRIPVRGKITEVVKGGVRVNLMGKSAFCPVSHIDMAYVEDPSLYRNQDSYFIIIEYNKSSNTLVVSRKEYLQIENYQRWKSFQAEWQKNPDEIHPGRISKFLDNGVLVELADRIIGFLPNSDLQMTLSGKKITDLFSIGDELLVKVTRITLDPVHPTALLKREGNRQTDWQEITQDYPVGKKIQARITRIISGGFLVQVNDQLQGFLPQSEVEKQNFITIKEMAVNSLIDLTIKDIDPIRRQIVMSIADPHQEEWKNYSSSHPSTFQPFKSILKSQSGLDQSERNKE
ncbi:MAG: S1 RNA-binding domain-containing protein [Candidatus Delongbacteria bacterium]|nr:S1 RNA-binding domain-containing protein [Candidatus Delongbacteria bacterium]